MKRTVSVVFTLLCLFATVTTVAAAPPGQQETFTDPFAYCAAVGTIDAPDARYTGPEKPESVIQALREAIGVAPDAPADLFIEATSWRCMDGKVYACNVGANIPCWEKADTSQTPSDAMTDFCATNPDADVIPAAVTGRTTVYTWRCSGGTPEIAEQFTEVDAAGYPATYWYEISAPAGEAPQQLPTTGGDSSVAPALLAFGLLLCVASLLGRRRLTADG